MNTPLRASPEWSKSRVQDPPGVQTNIKCFSDVPEFMHAVLKELQFSYKNNKLVKVSVEVLGQSPQRKTVAWVGADFLETSENQSR